MTYIDFIHKLYWLRVLFIKTWWTSICRLKSLDMANKNGQAYLVYWKYYFL